MMSTERIQTENLSQYGENIARGEKAYSYTSGAVVSRYIIKNINTLRHRRQKYGQDPESARSSDAEWLLDNFYLTHREGLRSRREIKHIKSLPKSASSPLPIVFNLCTSLVRSSGGEITKQRMKAFFDGCQTAYVLTQLELSLVIPMTQAAIISELASLYDSKDSTCTSENLFSSLRTLATLDFTDLLSEIDILENLLSTDPSGIYSKMSEETRNSYKSKIAELSHTYLIDEIRVAKRALHLASKAQGDMRHIGYWLFERPLGKEKHSKNGILYISINTFLTLATAILLGIICESVVAMFLSIFPLSEIYKSCIDRIYMSIYSPAHIPRMELENGIPARGRTICVISALLTNDKSGPNLAKKLEQYMVCNRDSGENLLFGILADLPDSKSKTKKSETATIEAAKSAIQELNTKYGGGFFLFLRERKYHIKDRKYMAYERKRGAILELAKLLQGNGNREICIEGNLLSLRGVHYILTLDEDTRLMPESARVLVGAMLHPLNTPKIDKDCGCVTQGYGIIHPRMATELSSVNKSDFSNIYANCGGCDPYGCAASELYMDAFDCGGFAGKGIIDIDTLLECTEKAIPENHVLSHDALEGAYLRGGYLSDLELLDSHPSTVLSYFRRSHRWIRGDMQNSSWITLRGKGFRCIDRYRLLDSLRRALLPELCFASFAVAFFAPNVGTVSAALFSLISLSISLIAEIVNKIFGENTAKSSFGKAYGKVTHSFIFLFCRLIFLPYEAYITASAMLTALWRLGITHKKLLQWTPASNTSKNDTLQHFHEMWFSVWFGIITLVFAPSIMGKAAGFIWALSPFFAVQLSKNHQQNKPQISQDDRVYLLQSAREIYAYFEDFCTPEDHFLPPDNYQFCPPVGIAHRTSPTNIGLCLLSALSAIDLKIVTPEKALGIIENILVSCTRLPKIYGHLYNWYNTKTLKPLHPAYISTADSGNLAICLYVLREGLWELGEERLASLCDELLEPMSFAPLYDKAHRLFTIGIDCETGKMSEGHYDLMASEARTASFIAISRGDVPRRHYKALSRALVQNDGYRGMVSWSGSMFEYLMPSLFFKSEPGSLMYETEHFCLHSQIIRTKKLNIPFGISESAFYALDTSMSYSYKAHGCSALALKRGQNSEAVISPYSSFLALCISPCAAIANLKALENYDARCKYGFFDAIDFTKCRSGEKGYEPVQCVMAHHEGMSMLAITNLLCNDIIRKRVLKSPIFEAYSSLLNERLSTAGVLMYRDSEKIHERPPRSCGITHLNQGNNVNFLSPECTVLSNGIYDIMLTSSGISKCSSGSITPYIAEDIKEFCFHGIEIFLKLDGKMTSLLPDPMQAENVRNSWKLTDNSAIFFTETSEISAQVKVSVSPSNNAEKREINITTNDGSTHNCEVIVMFRPVLAYYEDYVNHPAFFNLGLHAKKLDNSLILRRLQRGEMPETYLCFSASENSEFSVRRNLVPGRGGLLQAINENIPSKLGWLRDPMVTAKIPIRISSKESRINIALSVGTDEKRTTTSATLPLVESEDSKFISDCAAALLMSDTEMTQAMKLLSTINYPESKTEKPIKASDLWQHGISGDYPLIYHHIAEKSELEKSAALMREHTLLCMTGQWFDLVFIVNEGGDYLHPIANALKDQKQKYGKGSSHIFIITDGDKTPIEHFANKPQKDGQTPIIFNNRILDIKNLPLQDIPNYKWNTDGSFEFYVNHSLPPRAWTNILTNGNFGYVATDCGTGNMWYKNARENKINRWLCDSLTTVGTETLYLDGESVFATPNDENTTVKYGLGYAEWTKQIRNTTVHSKAFIPLGKNCRVFIITAEGAHHITWFTDLVLSGSPKTNNCEITFDDGIFTAQNPESPFPEDPFKIATSVSPKKYTSNRKKHLMGTAENELGTGDCIEISCVFENTFVLVCGCDESDVIRSLTEFSLATANLSETTHYWQKKTAKTKIYSQSEPLNRLMNSWLPYQALACRLMGRTSIYQSGGAIGFRDQLQDAVNLISLDSNYAKSQILYCSRHQYEEGDVMHWWHELSADTKGVRTRCSDDLLWLTWAVCEYCEQTSDTEILFHEVCWLSSDPLGNDEHDRYEKANFTNNVDTILTHAKRAIDMVLTRGVGIHGLLKIGNGDWNDGFSSVGTGGKGESVWLTWFCSIVADKFSSLLHSLGYSDDGEKYQKVAEELGKSADEQFEDGRYIRGYFDDGTKIGSADSVCCKIDSIAQSFAAFCKYSDSNKVDIALNTAVNELFDEDAKIIKLFTPPFEDSYPNPGYIESYGPGFRENGGQYTHAAIWLMMALRQRGKTDIAEKMLNALIPENHDINIYGAEPYIIAADICSNPDCLGEAGWSFYTGSAGWLFRAVFEWFGSAEM